MQTAEAQTITTISARADGRLRQFFLDLYQYRDLFVSLLERDVKVRYKQTALGVIWVLIQPLVAAGAYTVIFGKVAQMPTDGLPGLLFFMLGQVPWIAFSSALTGAAASMEANAGLISKVYFPRLIVPLATIVGTLPDFLIGFALINVTALLHGVWNPLLLLVMLPLLLLQQAAAAGLGLFLTALNAQYRDVKYTVPFLINLGLLATPVFYPLDRLPAWAVALQGFNPVAGAISTFRWTLGGPAPSPGLLLANAAAALFYLSLGVLFFRARERRLVDVL